ncbi:MAG: EAL domain-containing protein, partial [Campylobacterales bacterium]|nr:EAL domain-containing protein [Campylobacterales bacterium]
NIQHVRNNLSFETLHLKKDGSRVPVSVHVTFIKDEDNTVKQRIVNIIDISSRKILENELRTRHLEYLNLAENLPDAIACYDKECKRTYVNPEWTRINGMLATDVLNKTPVEASSVIKSYAKAFQGRLEEVIRTCKGDEWDFDFTGLDGKGYVYSICATPEYDVDGNIKGVLTTARDVTGRKYEEEKINEQFKLFFERQLVGMAITSPQKGWLKVNDKLCSMFGYSLDEFKAMTWADMTHPEDLQADIERFNLLLDGTIDEYMLEKRFVHKNGAVVFTNLAVTCVREKNGNVDCVLALVEDITQRVIVQNKIKSLNTTLEQRIHERTLELEQANEILRKEAENRRKQEALLVKKEQEFRTLAENSPNIIMRYNENAHRIYANAAFAKQTGIPRELILTSELEFQWDVYFEMVNMDLDEYRRRIKKVFKSGENDAFVVRWTRHVDSCEVAHHLHLVAEKNEDGQTTGVLAIGHDITKSLESEQQLKQSVELTEGIINAIPDLLFEVDKKGTYLNFWSHDNALVASQKKYLLGRKINDVLAPESAQIAHKAIKEAEKKGTSFGEIYSIKYPDGERWYELSVAKRSTGNFLALARDVTGRYIIEKRVEFMAHHDILTELPNRLLLKDRAERIIENAKRNGQKSAFLFIDLDGFKTINDSLGHVVGDMVLKAVGQRLQRCTRSSDTLSRHGGDEFVLIIPEINHADEVIIVVNKIIQKFKKSFEINNKVLSLTASIGIAIYPQHGKDYEELLLNSDAAMYKAKENGKNTYCFFTHQMTHDRIGLFQIQNDLKRAIHNREFLLHYQPQIDLSTNKIVGAEALVRWAHPYVGMIPPGNFISVAESCGLIIDIGEWVMHEACRQASLWNKNGKDIVVAVNISAVQFKRGNLVEVVKSALETSALNPRYLELELTESLLINDAENILKTVKTLKELGISLSIDDFGTGYSSLAYLKRFAVDKLKIDQSFVKDIVRDKENASIVNTIVQIAKSFNLKSIAEGVEEKDVLDVLQGFGCDEVQGYYFAKPMSADEFEKYFKTRRKG